MKIPRWAQILIGVGIVGVFLGIGAIIAITAWVSQNVNISDSSESRAMSELNDVRQQFSQRPPLLELTGVRPRYTNGKPPEKLANPPRLEALHALVWDPREEKLARFRLPYWVLRLKSDPIRLSSYAAGLDDDGVDLRPEDIEKYGPGIILDTESRDGERILVWTQ